MGEGGGGDGGGRGDGIGGGGNGGGSGGVAIGGYERRRHGPHRAHLQKLQSTNAGFVVHQGSHDATVSPLWKDVQVTGMKRQNSW